MHHASGLEKTLARKLSEFLDSQISYSFRRLAAAELERLYVGPKDSKGQKGFRIRASKTACRVIRNRRFRFVLHFSSNERRSNRDRLFDLQLVRGKREEKPFAHL